MPKIINYYPLEYILPLIGMYSTYSFIVDNKTYVARIGTDKLLLFKSFPECSYCKKKGSYFTLEKHQDSNICYLNLYTEDGLILTKDHIVPKSKGGPDLLHNYQTLCQVCNGLKADTL